MFYRKIGPRRAFMIIPSKQYTQEILIQFGLHRTAAEDTNVPGDILDWLLKI